METSKQYTKQELINKLADVIATKPQTVISALRLSGVNISNKANQSKIVQTVSTEIYTNKKFLDKVAPLMERSKDHSSFVGALISAATTVFGEVAKGKTSKAELAAEQERTRQELYRALAARQSSNKNVIPAIIIGGVMLIAVVAVIVTLRPKKSS